MRTGIIIAVIVILFGGGIYLANHQNRSKDESSQSKSTFQLATGTVIYDVRTAEEYAQGHAVDAINWPLDKLQSGEYPDTSKDAPIAVYCHSGNRSSQATAILKGAGYTDITDIGAYTNLSSYGLSTT